MSPSSSRQNEGKSRVWRSVLLALGEPSAAAGALSAGADAVLIDSRTRAAGVAAILSQRDRTVGTVFAQVSADDSKIDSELDAIMPCAPEGIALSGFGDGSALAMIGARIAAREAISGLPDGSTAIMAIIATGADLMQLGSLRGATPRLVALGWDADALAADIGSANPREGGALIEPLVAARSMCLAAAASAGVPAIDAAMPAAGNEEFIADADRARRHGFRGKFARTAEEVGILNEIFADIAAGSGPKP